MDWRGNTLLAAADAACRYRSGSPLFPFVGAIEDVGIYKVALEPATILTHFHNGNGIADNE
jgi:hypothetical protein